MPCSHGCMHLRSRRDPAAHARTLVQSLGPHGNLLAIVKVKLWQWPRLGPGGKLVGTLRPRSSTTRSPAPRADPPLHPNS